MKKNVLNKLHIQSFGEGKACVFFHGWGFDQSIWHSLLPELLDRGQQVFLVDLPGFGLSSLMDWEIFKSTLLQQLPYEFSVLGWSLGGLFATRLALEEPVRVTHLMSVASSPCFVQMDDWPGVAADVFTQFYEQVCQHPEKTLHRFIQLQCRQKMHAHHFSWQQDMPRLHGLRAGLDVLLEWDLRAALHSLQQPACYIFGTLDTITPLALMHTMQKEFHNFQYHEIRSAAHVPFLSHAELFLPIMENFLR